MKQLLQLSYKGTWNTESIRGETLIDQIEASIDLPLWALQV